MNRAAWASRLRASEEALNMAWDAKRGRERLPGRTSVSGTGEGAGNAARAAVAPELPMSPLDFSL